MACVRSLPLPIRDRARAMPYAMRHARYVGPESLCGSAWLGSVWGGFLGGILGGIARVGFPPRESTLPDPLNYYRPFDFDFIDRHRARFTSTDEYLEKIFLHPISLMWGSGASG